ncbi:MAG TPA: aminotransferase class I/II-fold pyridoxal phosphate-dependent enzyme [Sedimentisphaerales bacterium]|nr:aminotransferase class I/II-fold pyridoxal phosphate-dependent enzyme [Sedimentisphaerales bacterium]
MSHLHKRPCDLAILSGRAALSETLHVGGPNIGDRGRLRTRIEDVLDRRWLSNGGPYVRELERRVADLAGVRHCLAMCNGTVALEIAIRAMGFGGEVIVPSFTFVATAHSLRWQGITPVFCDIDPRTHTIDPARVESLITPRTTGILGVHVWGRPCDVESLEEIARRHRLGLLFDAAHAFACSHRGRMVGSFGDAEVFSFHATKFVNSFEGGAIVTNDSDLAARVELMRNFGFAGYDRVVSLGMNGKMNEVCAAMGVTSLESLDGFVEINRRNYEQYRRELADAPGLEVAVYDDADRSNYQYVAVTVDGERLELSRDDFVRILAAENVMARRYFYPGCHRMEPYRSEDPDAYRRLPHTEILTSRVMCLPTGTSVSSEAVSTICHVLRLAAANHRELRCLLDDRGLASAGRGQDVRIAS